MKSQFYFLFLYKLIIALIYFIIYIQNIFYIVLNTSIVNYKRLLYLIMIMVKYVLNTVNKYINITKIKVCKKNDG